MSKLTTDRYSMACSKYSSLLIVVLVFSSLACAQDNALTYKAFFDPTFGDFVEELTEAKMQNKQGILFFFDMNGCPHCQYMKDRLLSQKAAQDYFGNHFLCFMVDIEGGIEVTDFHGQTMTQKKFAARNGVRATPTMLFTDIAGKEITRFQGTLPNVGEFLQLGRYVVGGHYRKGSFREYKLAFQPK